MCSCMYFTMVGAEFLVVRSIESKPRYFQGVSSLHSHYSCCRFGGPTIVGEWSIADTDCAVFVNSVGSGYLQLQDVANSFVEVAGKGLMMVLSVLAIRESLVVRIRSIAPVRRRTQMSPITAILTRNFSRITLLLRLPFFTRELTCSGLALNVLGDGSTGIPSRKVILTGRTWDTQNATQCSIS
jgi:hypothetical protein